MNILISAQVMMRLCAHARDAGVEGARQPVLITTSGNCLAEDVGYYMTCGADDTFGKPLPNKFDLARKIITLLKRKRGADFAESVVLPPPKRARGNGKKPAAAPAAAAAPRRSTRKRAPPADGGGARKRK